MEKEQYGENFRCEMAQGGWCRNLILTTGIQSLLDKWKDGHGTEIWNTVIVKWKDEHGAVTLPLTKALNSPWSDLTSEMDSSYDQIDHLWLWG